MGTYTIGEVADRSGFSASALRYYEGIGLLEPAGRSEAGYRLYDEQTLARLAFIARAKQLGCSLDDIADLAAVWDNARCAPVQRRLHELVTDKLADARRQIGELTAFVDQLRQTAERLAGPATDAPCGEGCACMAAPANPTAATASGVPVMCTLAVEAAPDRLAAWQRLLANVTSRQRLSDGGLRVTVPGEVDLGELARLVAAEQECCAFFAFSITVDERGVALEVRAPGDAGAVVDALFGAAD